VWLDGKKWVKLKYVFLAMYIVLSSIKKNYIEIVGEGHIQACVDKNSSLFLGNLLSGWYLCM